MSALRYIAPSGTPVTVKDIFGCMLDELQGRDAIATLCDAIARRYAIKHCLAVSSGRAAMAHLFEVFKTLGSDPTRNEIVMPAYTCYSVPAAAVVAGLKPRIVDIDPNTLSYRRDILESVDFSKVLAIVSANLYGYPNELTYLEQLAAQHHVFLLDDAAQAMQARSAGRAVGTFGDAGLYSFDKGKNITSLQGGVVVTRRDDIAAALRLRLERLPVTGISEKLRYYTALSAYSILLRPWLYWIPANLPFLGLGKTPYTTDIPVYAYTQAAAALAQRLFDRIDEITRQRRTRAEMLLQAIGDAKCVTTIQPQPDAEPVYLRLPLLARDSDTRQRLLHSLDAAGIGATASYPRSIGNIPELGHQAQIQHGGLSGACAVAERIITLPTQYYLTNNDIQRTATVMKGCLQ